MKLDKNKYEQTFDRRKIHQSKTNHTKEPVEVILFTTSTLQNVNSYYNIITTSEHKNNDHKAICF